MLARAGQGERPEAARRPQPAGGFVMIGALLVTVLVTALGTAALYLSQQDLMLAGNYRVQRTAEVSADAGLELVKAMLYGADPQLHLPLSVPANTTTSVSWRAGADVDGDGVGDGISYTDGDLDLRVSVRYKQEDTINYNTAETYADEVVRYGQDYHYADAPKSIGRQPVYTVTFADARTGVKAEADLISAVGFRTPAAIYVKGRVRMEKNYYANEEAIEVVSGQVNAEQSIPALATTKSQSEANVFIQRAVSLSGGGATRSYTDQGGFCSGGCTYHPDCNADWGQCGDAASPCVSADPSAIWSHPTPASPYCPLTTLNISTGPYASAWRCWPDIAPRVYSDAEIAAELAAGNINAAREMMHVLLGVGERDADLEDPDPEFDTNGDGAISPAESKAEFNFDVADPQVVRYDYRNAAGAVPTLEEMLGASFADLRSLADRVLSGDETVQDYNCNSIAGGKDLSGMTLGTAAAPELVFFESNMNDDGSANGQPELSLVTTAGPVHGYGILVINGDATIYGSIDWTGLMVVRGKLHFRPWAGGTGNFRSGPELATRWNGFIMIGGDPADAGDPGLYLWTYAGGSVRLGFSSSEVAAVKGVISGTIPHKVLSWRRAYD